MRADGPEEADASRSGSRKQKHQHKGDGGEICCRVLIAKEWHKTCSFRLSTHKTHARWPQK